VVAERKKREQNISERPQRFIYDDRGIDSEDHHSIQMSVESPGRLSTVEPSRMLVALMPKGKPIGSDACQSVNRLRGLVGIA